MARSDIPVVIEAAVNGGTSKARNPHVPVTVDEIATDALACLEAGAAIVHQHDDLRGAGDNRPETMAALSLAVYEKVLAERPDALLYPTANFRGPVEHRWAHHFALDDAGVLRCAFVDPGSVNIWTFTADGHLGGSDFVYANSHKDILWKLAQCRERGLGPNMAVFEGGFLRTVVEHERAGALPPGTFIKLYFGGPRAAFGLPPTLLSLQAYLAMLEGSQLPWAVAVLGGDVVASGIARAALEAGGHLQVGLEDHHSERTPTNRELVEQAVALCEEVGRPVATPDEAARLLGLPK